MNNLERGILEFRIHEIQEMAKTNFSYYQTYLESYKKSGDAATLFRYKFYMKTARSQYAQARKMLFRLLGEKVDK